MMTFLVLGQIPGTQIRINIAHLVIVFGIALLVVEVNLFKRQHQADKPKIIKKNKKSLKSTARA